ncbi:MAG: glutamine synthetase III [Myxococcota bacterium]|nr:glutamine synthetase III [Myxococcota bacterium]
MNNPRYHAVQVATTRKPRQFDRFTFEDGILLNTEDYFGEKSFGLSQMQERLPAEIVERYINAIETGAALDRSLADAIAQSVHKWALEHGATHFCHWFQPMTGATAEKHDSFLELGGAEPIFNFSGAQLIQSEPDASSFPSGGMRTTFEARGYTAWDPSSPIFLSERENGTTLCIPSAFVSYTGHALDKKTPLLRSMEVLNSKAVELCHKVGLTDVGRVTATAGPEQEYFLIDKAYTALRPDLLLAGRTVLGAAAPKGQSLDDHYFGAVPSRVIAFMHEVEFELYRLGVPAKTRHNEVAPSQFEIAVVYSEANVAADHNQLVMEMLQRVAERHDFKCLLHEKPFAGVNGSGKHINWSMATDTGKNLLSPSKNPAKNIPFLACLSAIVLGVHRNADLLRCAIASYSNDFRLGANEAPPAIISVFLGEQLTHIANALADGQTLSDSDSPATIELGIQHMPDLDKDNTDRNRTSPFAFTGNKFEFRAAGSKDSVSFPITCINAAVSEGIDILLKLIDEKGDVLLAIQEAFKVSTPIRFEGDNYSDAWVEEAAKRGLPNLRKTPEALEVLQSDRIKALFSGFSILSEAEIDSRYHVKLEQYITTVEIELEALIQLTNQAVVPALTDELTAACAQVAALQSALGGSTVGRSRAGTLQELLGSINQALAALEKAIESTQTLSHTEAAKAYAYTVLPKAEALREQCDAAESLISDSRWTLPKYRELLFQN